MDLDHYYATRIAQYRIHPPTATNPRHATNRTPFLTRLRLALHAATTKRTQPTSTTAPHRPKVLPID
jgi:hypothetical protein